MNFFQNQWKDEFHESLISRTRKEYGDSRSSSFPRNASMSSSFRTRVVVAVALLLLTAAQLSAAPAFKAPRLTEMDTAVTNAIGENNIPGAVLWLEQQGLSWRGCGSRSD